MIVILSGPVHGGKTTLIQKSLSRWASRGLGFGGFLSVAVSHGSEGVEYDFLDIKDGRRLPFLRRTGETEWEKIGPYFFVPQTLEIARSLVLSADPAEVLIVDEVGPLELAHGGLWPALKSVIFRPEMKTLLVAREEILEDLFGLLGTTAPLIVDVCDPNAQKLLDQSLFGPAKPHEDQG
jgi:nucleoside-triphosphatase THEP1